MEKENRWEEEGKGKKTGREGSEKEIDIRQEEENEEKDGKR